MSLGFKQTVVTRITTIETEEIELSVEEVLRSQLLGLFMDPADDRFWLMWKAGRGVRRTYFSTSLLEREDRQWLKLQYCSHYKEDRNRLIDILSEFDSNYFQVDMPNRTISRTIHK